MTLTLQIKKRDAGGNLNALRDSGFVPAVFYGPQEESTPITINEKEFLSAYKNAGTSAIIVLQGLNEDKEALIHNVAIHPVSGKILHADFYVIERGKKVNVTVPINYTGESPAEKQGLVVMKLLHEIEMAVRPSEIPQSIDVDLSKLEDSNSTITISDLSLPESAEPALDSSELIASVTSVKEETEPEEERSIEDVEISSEKSENQEKEENTEE